MPSPVADYYSVASGQPVYAGRSAGGRLSGAVTLDDAVAAGAFGVNFSALSGAVTLDGAVAAGAFTGRVIPTWVSAATVGTWGTIPATNLLSDLNPANNAAINPNFPNPPEWTNTQSAIISAWNSMSVNPATGEMWIWGGGHADYGGNEPYVFDPRSNTPSWVMRRYPSGAIGNPITDGGSINSPALVAASATGFYSDGRPRPTHTYNSTVYVSGKGMSATNLYYVFPHVNGPSKAVYFNEATNDWGLLSDYTALGNSNFINGGSCYDPSRNCVWLLGEGAFNMVKLDCATGVGTRYGAVDNHAMHCTLKYDVANDLIYIISESNSAGWLDFASRMSVFDPVNSVFYVLPAYTGALPTSQTISPTGGGAAWDEAGGRLLLWNHQGDRTQVGVLTRPASNLRTTAWAASSFAIDVSNAITPPVAQINGTYNRFDYLPTLGVCVLVNSVNQPVYFFKVRSV